VPLLASHRRQLPTARRNCCRGTQQFIIVATARQNSGHRWVSTRPARRSRRSVSRSWRSSRLATDPGRTPSAAPSGTSVGMSRTVVVIGPTTTRANRDTMRRRVSTTTGRIFSSATSAHQTSRRRFCDRADSRVSETASSELDHVGRDSAVVRQFLIPIDSWIVEP